MEVWCETRIFGATLWSKTAGGSELDRAARGAQARQGEQEKNKDTAVSSIFTDATEDLRKNILIFGQCWFHFGASLEAI